MVANGNSCRAVRSRCRWVTRDSREVSTADEGVMAVCCGDRASTIPPQRVVLRCWPNAKAGGVKAYAPRGTGDTTRTRPPCPSMPSARGTDRRPGERSAQRSGAKPDAGGADRDVTRISTRRWYTGQSVSRNMAPLDILNRPPRSSLAYQVKSRQSVTRTTAT